LKNSSCCLREYCTTLELPTGSFHRVFFPGRKHDRKFRLCSSSVTPTSYRLSDLYLTVKRTLLFIHLGVPDCLRDTQRIAHCVCTCLYIHKDCVRLTQLPSETRKEFCYCVYASLTAEFSLSNLSTSEKREADLILVERFWSSKAVRYSTSI